uniref:Predicted protein n=1 Tax=Hordeum vulgare subsp. vulgare TaxID=112509 RepID=F2DI31_HORVV|nr:predicted protein [Hordeum vulgare subsp. vulgare]
MHWPALKPSPARKKPAPEPMASSAVLRDLEETDDGWIVLPPAPPNSGQVNASADEEAFDPAPDAIVARYLPLRRALRCDGLPRQIHDADVYGAHPGFLAAVYPPANGRSERFFFVCRAQCQGGRRRAGPGAYRLGSEARLLGGAAYCHAFRYYEDEAETGSASTRETEWRMDEYGECRSAAAAAAFDMVVCKLYPARGGAVHTMLGVHDPASPWHRPDVHKPQVLVQLYLDSLSLGDPRRCRMYAAADVFAAHPAALTVAFPAANDRCEWFFAVHRQHKLKEDGEDKARPRRAGPGTYVLVREGSVVNGRGEDIGYRRVFLYREDDATVRRVSRTEWWMEEYGFGKDFPHGELPPAKTPTAEDEEDELVVYKLYLKMAGHRR